MDGVLWAAPMSAPKRHHSRHFTSSHSHLDRPHTLDDLQGDDDLRSDYTCPFCYEDFDIATLCSHIDDEHCYESNLTRRRRCRKAGTSSSNICLSFLGKELRESNRQALLGGASSIVVEDPLLSTVVFTFHGPETDNDSKPSAVSKEASEKSFASSIQQKSRMGKFKKSRTEPEVEVLQAKFVQHLLLSMFFTGS